MSAIVGIDIGARFAAFVGVPLNWDGDWKRVLSLVIGEPLRRDASDLERVRRCESIAMQGARFAVSNGADAAWIEGYAFSQNTAAHVLAEVGGCVRLELARAGIALHTANMGTSRKLLLGRLPRKGAKDAVIATLRAAGAMFETPDEYDAFTAANLGLAAAGAYCFAQSEAA